MQFRGIPYAEAPSGRNRFKAPVRRKPWSTPFLATEYGRICPQLFTYNRLPADQLTGDLEDCLTLNVFTKTLNAKQPVMFYVHGGSLQVGFAYDYPGGYLLEQDIVLVVIQYRLGMLGFSGTKTSNMPGNLGLMDTMLALEWVQQYISAFGGDKSKVTVFGESSGGDLGGALLASPKTPPSSFHRLITQSGSAVDKLLVNQDPIGQVERVCRALQCRQCERIDKMESCLKKADVWDILRATETEGYGLIVGDFHGTIPQTPAQLIATSNIDVPIMTGFTKHDGSLVVGSLYDAFKASNTSFSSLKVGQFANGLLGYLNDTSGMTDNALTRLLFPLNLWNSSDHKRAIPAYFDLANILFFKSNEIGFTNKLFAKSYSSPIYFYTFDYEGAQTNFGFDTGNSQYPFNGGVHHTDDLLYLFPMKPLNTADTEMAKKMVALWTSFAMTGAPKLAEGPPVLPMQYPRGPYFHINQPITVEDDVLKEFTATIDDRNNNKLDRPDKEF
ncbi:glutactin-like isoform X2 [Eurosta solidaginis]|uniref:glutactin-like isoform X2 n=1 Tax=Eurosta solidaginis TaxID=178769 RepID=UPI0035310855